MAVIRIADLEVFYSVGVSDEERAKPQRLLLTIDMEVDIAAAALTDRIIKTIDYFAVAQLLLKYGDGRSWKLIEKLVKNIAELIKVEFEPQGVTVEVKKFAVKEAGYVSVTWTS
jgi:FolB domain-containing protein